MSRTCEIRILCIACVVIDEESLQTLMDAPPVEERKDRLFMGGPVRFVKVVEAWPEMEDDPIPGTFPGWMKCEIKSLWDVRFRARWQTEMK